MRARIWVTTLDELRVERAGPLFKPIWYRARDARVWLPEYRDFVATLKRGPGRKHFVKQRRFVVNKLPTMPRHSLYVHANATETREIRPEAAFVFGTDPNSSPRDFRPNMAI